MVQCPTVRWNDRFIKVKGIREEDFCQYKEPSMFIIFPYCSFKCEKDSGQKCCQNNELMSICSMDVTTSYLLNLYLSNPITSAIVCGGLEPFDSFDDLFDLIEEFRTCTHDTIVIYTGYNEEEIKGYTEALKRLYFELEKSIIVKRLKFA